MGISPERGGGGGFLCSLYSLLSQPILPSFFSLASFLKPVCQTHSCKEAGLFLSIDFSRDVKQKSFEKVDPSHFVLA